MDDNARPNRTLAVEEMLIEEWALLPQEMLHQLVLSMRRRQIVEVYWEVAMRREHIMKQADRISKTANDRRGRPSSTTTQINTARVEEKIQNISK
ncbi:hypothetical protein TNCV_750391 [Trichonephila clavipes]|nr:hypothetical protein TNCV_750391 [Trichonephila clavipes]